MNSALFKKHGISESILKELKQFAQIEDTKLQQIAEWIKIHKNLELIKVSDCSELSESTGLSNNSIASIIGLTIYLIDSFAEFSESVDLFMNDLKELKVFENSSDYTKIQTHLKSLEPIKKEIFLSNQIKKALCSGLPYDPSIVADVVLKPIFKEEFDPEKADISDYKPDSIKFIPIAQFVCNNDDNKQNYYFQMSLKELDIFIQKLLALQKQMKHLHEKASKV